MNKFFTLSLVSIALFALTDTVSSLDVNNPWHVMSFEGDKEVAFYNTEVITGIEVTAQTMVTVLVNRKKVSYSTVVALCGFDPHRNDVGSTNEILKK